MSLQRVPLNNFRGGLNVRDSPFELQQNESPDLLNVTISALVGQLESRKGKKRIDLGGIPENETADFAKQVVIGNGKRFLMMSINGDIYCMTPTGEIKKLFNGTEGTIWDFELYSDAAFKDWVYCGNGVNNMQKWDGEAASTVTWEAGKGSIPKGGVLCVWENRMFISYVSANVQRVYFSEFSDPEATVAEYGFVDVRGPEDDLDAIQDLAVLGARLIVLKRRDIFFISSAVTMLNRRIGGPGVWARFQVTELEDKLYFFNPQGIFSTGGATVAMESGSINNYFPQHLNEEAATKARLIATKDSYPRLLLSMPIDGSTINNILIEMVPHINFRRIGGRRYLLLPAFMLHTLPATALACWNPLGTEEIIVGCGTVAGLNPFPTGVAILDSFNRANENPLSNGGKWRESGLHILEKRVVNQAGSLFEEESFWSTEITEPVINVEVTRLFAIAAAKGVGVGLQFGTGEAGSAYTRAKWVATEEKWEVLLTTTVGGETNLLVIPKVPALKVKDILGLTVYKGKVYVGYKPWIGGKSEPWEILGVISSSVPPTKAKPGIVLSGAGAERIGVNNFAAEKVVTTSPPIGAVCRLFYGTTDEGEPIEAHWHSAWLPIQEQEPKERIRRLNVELQGDAYVDVFKDFEQNPVFSQLLPREGERGEYDEPVGEGLEYRFTRVRPETRGRYHSIQFRSNEGAPFLINSAELVVRGGKEE